MILRIIKRKLKKQMLTGEQIPDKGDLLKMTNDSNSAKIKRRKTLLSILGNAFTYPGNSIGAISTHYIAYKLLAISLTRKPGYRKLLSLWIHHAR